LERNNRKVVLVYYKKKISLGLFGSGYIKIVIKPVSLLKIIAALVILLSSLNYASAREVDIKIAVLAHRGPESCIKTWKPTADYLTRKIPNHSFSILPVDNDSIMTALENNSVGFVLTNPGSHVQIENLYRITPVATLKKQFQGKAMDQFGAVVFARADRDDISDLNDLKAKRFIAVHEKAFGGYLLALKEMRSAGVSPGRDFKEVLFGGFPQKNIVFSVQDGQADAGTVRTGILEKLVSEGQIKLDNFKILNPKKVPEFPLLLSTDLYPEWPLSSLEHTPRHLANKVFLALAQLDETHPVSIDSGTFGWGFPRSYAQVKYVLNEIDEFESYKSGAVGLFERFWKLVLGLYFVFLWLLYNRFLKKFERFREDSTNPGMPRYYKWMAPPDLGILVLLILIGIGLNSLNIPLFLGVDFIFGSIPVLVAISFFSNIWAIAAAVAISSYTYVLWGHPYAVIIFVVEAVFVLWRVSNTESKDFIKADLLYWITMGIPLVYFFYTFGLHQNWQSVQLILFKQAINGIFNAVLAQIIIDFFVTRGWLSRMNLSSRIPFNRLILTYLASFILLSGLLITIFYNQENLEDDTHAAAVNISDELSDINNILSQNREKLMEDLSFLSSRFEKVDLGHTDFSEFKKTCHEYLKRHNQVLGIKVTDDKGNQLIATSELGRWKKLIEEHENIQDLYLPNAPFVSPLYNYQQGLDPYFILSVPVEDNRWLEGIHVQAFISSSMINSVLEPFFHSHSYVLIKDSNGVPVSNSFPDNFLSPEQYQLANTQTSIFKRPDIYHWIPSAEKISDMARWRQSLIGTEKELVGFNGWKLTVGSPMEPYVDDIREDISVSLCVIFFSFVMLFFIATRMSMSITKSLMNLEEITNSAKDHDWDNLQKKWPKNIILEIDNLANNFLAMIGSVEKTSTESMRTATELTQLIDTANAPIFGVDPDGNINEWNQMVSRITGFSKQEVLGQNLVNHYITGEYKKAVYEVLEKALHGDETDNYEVPLYTKTGERVMILLNATTRRDAEGTIVGVVGVGQDITEIDQIRTEMERTATELTQLIDTANAPIFGVDPDGNINEWNQMVSRITGFSKQEVLGQNLVNHYITGEYKKAVYEVLEKALHGDETDNYEVPLYTKTGERVMILLNATTRRDAEGTIVGVVGVGQDITEISEYRNNLEKMIDQRTKDLNHALNNMEEAKNSLENSQSELMVRNRIANVFLTSKNHDVYNDLLNIVLNFFESPLGLIGFINNAGDLEIPSLKGYVMEMCRVKGKDIIFKKESWGGMWGDTLSQGKSFLSNKDLKVPEGHLKLERALTVPIIVSGDVIGLLAIANRKEDFTESDLAKLEAVSNHIAPLLFARLQKESQEKEKKVAEKRLQESLNDTEEARDRIDGILKSVADGLIVTDIHNRVILMNRAAEDLLNVRFSEVIDRPIDFAIQDKTLRDKVKETLNRKTTGYLFDFELQDQQSGTEKIMRARTSVIFDRDNKESGIVTIIHDVTHEREVDRMKTEFISTAAHELRTPLTSIQGFSEILLTKKSLKAEEQTKFLNYINGQAVGLGKIINDLLNVSRIESGRGFMLHKEPCFPGEMIEQIIPYFRENNTSHSFETKLPSSKIELFVDKEKMGQVLKNLLSNAVKYSPGGGGITLSIENSEDSVIVSIQDQGIGMSSEQVEKIFDKFYRADASNTAIEGTGLGMTIVRYIIEAHEGAIWIESEPGRGTTVYFKIPINQNKGIKDENNSNR
jgi:PAS domain S-box-containing protein